MNLAVDIGNTLIKVGVFNADKLIKVYHFKNVQAVSIKKITEKHNIDNAIICSVGKNDGSKLFKSLNSEVNIIKFDETTKLPIANNYKTPKTLGKDRIAVAVGGATLFTGNNILIIQLGTCITYDFVNSKKQYLGGAISPGLAMRLKALHTFTGKLPLIKPENIHYRLGSNTTESILSGVINGMTDEMDAAINYYHKHYKSLKVLISGGDAHFFESMLKNQIFAQPNLVLYGLNEIINYNVEGKN